MSVAALAERIPEHNVLQADFPCPEVGILTMRRTVNLAAFGQELGLHPAAHNANGDLLWDVKAQAEAGNGTPRSHTAEEFVWHTDASFEEPPPRYFMLQVLHGDRYGGGQQNFMRLEELLGFLDEDNTKALADILYRWKVPAEFQKEEAEAELPILFKDESGADCIRYRRECLLTDAGRLDITRKLALSGLERAISAAPTIEHIPQARELILVDNWHALHAREAIRDPRRHLQRVRFAT